jgi:HTH-type transcriptional regulator/antitoxin HigA
MSHAHKAVPEPQAILRAWLPFRELIGVTSVRTEEDYAQARATIDALVENIGDDEDHPLAEVLDYLAEQVRVYEEVHHPIGIPEPQAILHFLMEQHGLSPEDIADVASTDDITDILDGKREIGLDLAQCLARRFRVRVNLFLREKPLG